MKKPALDDGQKDAILKMKPGCILNGDVGSGKSRTALAYYYGNFSTLPLYIITTAKKRDSKEWEEECEPWKIIPIVDSWNNIKKYSDLTGAFVIFDEDRVTGSGTWARTFIKISKHNKWIILSATPGDTWSDYWSVFVANGFYKNKTEFEREHVVWNRFTKFPQIDRYVHTKKLHDERRSILVKLKDPRTTKKKDITIWVDYDRDQIRKVYKTRMNPYTLKPIKNASEFCYTLRRIINDNNKRILEVINLLQEHPKIIVFYNFTYELEKLRNMCKEINYPYSEWNGQKHQPILDEDRWIYLCQYTAAAEGWNCIETDTMVFYSQTYSYKALKQSKGRIDRRNTPYQMLYYYFLQTHSAIDNSICKALMEKKNFNERNFTRGMFIE